MIIVHGGNRMDAVGRTPPRFPQSEVPRVEATVRQLLGIVVPRVVVSAPASGADLIVLSRAIELDIDVVVILPIDRDSFVAASVSDGERPDYWTTRFDAALAEAERRPESRVVKLGLDPESEWWFPANDHLIDLALKERLHSTTEDCGRPEPTAALVVRPMPVEDLPSVTDDLAIKAAVAGMLVMAIDPTPKADSSILIR